jgi:hypothetical protein
LASGRSPVSTSSSFTLPVTGCLVTA